MASKTKLAVVGSLGAIVFTGLGVGAGVALADQPHMQTARDDLKRGAVSAADRSS